MKKIIALIMIMAVAFTGCSNKYEIQKTNTVENSKDSEDLELLFEDYGKTWTLTNEELENDA